MRYVIMKKLMFIAAACLALVMPKAAQAFDDCCDVPSIGDGFYVGGFAGVSFPDNVKQHRHRVKLDTGYLVGASLGYRTCNNFRFEGEVAYRHNDGKKHKSHHQKHHQKRGEFESTSVMANALYDFDMCWCVKPYVGFGLGYAHAKAKRGHQGHHNNNHHNDHRHSSKSSFAWQAIAGVAYPLTCNIDLDLQYRYFQATDIKHYNDNDIVAGLRYNF